MSELIWNERAMAIEDTYKLIRANAPFLQDESKVQDANLIQRLSVVRLSPELREQYLQLMSWGDSEKGSVFWDLTRSFWPKDVAYLKTVLLKVPAVSDHSSSEANADVFEVNDLLNDALKHTVEIDIEVDEGSFDSDGYIMSPTRMIANKMQRQIEKEERILQFLEWAQRFAAWRRSMEMHCKLQAKFQNDVKAIVVQQQTFACILAALFMASLLGLYGDRLSGAKLKTSSAEEFPSQSGPRVNQRASSVASEGDLAACARRGNHRPCDGNPLTSRVRIGHAPHHPLLTWRVSMAAFTAPLLLRFPESQQGQQCQIDQPRSTSTAPLEAAPPASQDSSAVLPSLGPFWQCGLTINDRSSRQDTPFGMNSVSSRSASMHVDPGHTFAANACDRLTQTGEVVRSVRQVGSHTCDGQVQTDEVVQSLGQFAVDTCEREISIDSLVEQACQRRDDQIQSERSTMDRPFGPPPRGQRRTYEFHDFQSQSGPFTPEKVSRPLSRRVEVVGKPSDPLPNAQPASHEGDKRSLYNGWVQGKGVNGV